MLAGLGRDALSGSGRNHHAAQHEYRSEHPHGGMGGRGGRGSCGARLRRDPRQCSQVITQLRSSKRLAICEGAFSSPSCSFSRGFVGIWSKLEERITVRAAGAAGDHRVAVVHRQPLLLVLEALGLSPPSFSTVPILSGWSERLRAQWKYILSWSACLAGDARISSSGDRIKP